MFADALFVTTVTTVTVTRTPPRFLSLRGLSYPAGYGEQFFGCGEAEEPEGELGGEGRTVERGEELAVGLALYVDAASHVDIPVAPRGGLPLPPGGVLHEEIVVFGVAGEHPSLVLSDAHAARLSGEQLEVHAQFGVGVEGGCVVAVGHGQG